MNYEEFNKGCFEEAKRLYKTANADQRYVLESLFPELKEFNDERVRKAIIEFFESEDDNTTYSLIPKKDILAWLEKQGKRQSIWTDSDRIMAFTLLRDVDQMTYISDEGKNERLQWLNSLEDKFNNGE